MWERASLLMVLFYFLFSRGTIILLGKKGKTAPLTARTIPLLRASHCHNPATARGMTLILWDKMSLLTVREFSLGLHADGIPLVPLSPLFREIAKPSPWLSTEHAYVSRGRIIIPILPIRDRDGEQTSTASVLTQEKTLTIVLYWNIETHTRVTKEQSSEYP